MIAIRSFWLALAMAAALPALGAEKYFDLTEVNTNGVPVDFRGFLYGKGKPGEWKILFDDVPPLLAPISDKAPTVSKRAVLAQVNADPTDERYPILLYEGESFGDFILTTRFKLVSGSAEQMAGIVFRLKDEKNFYVARVSGLGQNFRFYKVVDGERQPPIGPDLPITRGVWHELKVECRGNQIFTWLDGKEAIPAMTDNTFTSGRLGFWTKSDSLTYYTDTKVSYIPREIGAEKMVRDAAKKYERLKGLKVYTLNSEGQPKVVASKDETEKGSLGGKYEKDCITQGSIFYGKDKKTVSVVMPLRDRNGDSIAAVRVVMESFSGQTEQNALVRATPIVKEMQAKVQSLGELTE